MRRPRLTIALAFLLLAFVVLGVMFWTPVQRALAVSTVRQSMVNSKIAFGSSGKMARPPASIDARIVQALDWTFSKAHGYTGRKASDIYHDKYSDLFSAPIETIVIRNPGFFKGNAGAGLSWFPHLRQLILTDSGQRVTEDDWRKISTRVRRAVRLEQLELAGCHLSDDALTPLAGHPSLRNITVHGNDITPGCQTIFASMPRLHTLTIREPDRAIRPPLTWPEKDAFTAALPSIHVIFSR